MGSRALVIGVLLGAAAPAGAGGVDEARDHFKRGTAAYALGNFQKAAEEYEIAFSIEPDSALLYNAAQAHRLAGNKQRALTLYQNYLRFYSNDPKVKNQDEVRRHIETLRHAIETDNKTANAPPTGPAQMRGRSSASATPPPSTTAPPPVREPSTTAPPPATTTPPQSEAPAAAVSETPPPQRSEKPIYKKAWFWGVVAGGAVVVAGVITLGVVLGSGTDYPSASMGIAQGN
jgi:tetratricopeptide (TPR) repeat protein